MSRCETRREGSPRGLIIGGARYNFRNYRFRMNVWRSVVSTTPNSSERPDAGDTSVPGMSPNERLMLREQEIRAARVDGKPPSSGPIRIVEYDPAWPGLFEREAARVQGVLGERALAIEHAGSTSVPGLAAKPIVDMILVVADSADEPSYVPPMEAAGYVLRIRESDWFEHRLFKGPDAEINLHVFSTGCEEIERMLLFRNHLRAHPEERALYERTKRSLAAQKWQFVQHYADAKTEIVEAIVARARACSEVARPDA